LGITFFIIKQRPFFSISKLNDRLNKTQCKFEDNIVVIRSVNRRKNNAMNKRKGMKEQTVIHKTPHRKNERDERRSYGKVSTSCFTSGFRRVGNHG
jgi:hypothetical protein